MFRCFSKIRWNKAVIAGFVFMVIGTIVRQIEVFATMKYYTMPQYFGVWSKLMMPKAGPPPASFFLTSLIFSFVMGVVLAAFYDFVKDLLPKDQWRRVLDFVGILTVLSFVFFTMGSYLLFNLPVVLLVWWFISSVVIFLLATVVFVRILK